MQESKNSDLNLEAVDLHEDLDLEKNASRSRFRKN